MGRFWGSKWWKTGASIVEFDDLLASTRVMSSSESTMMTPSPALSHMDKPRPSVASISRLASGGDAAGTSSLDRVVEGWCAALSPARKLSSSSSSNTSSDRDALLPM
jgi:hypothetical protein